MSSKNDKNEIELNDLEPILPNDESSDSDSSYEVEGKPVMPRLDRAKSRRNLDPASTEHDRIAAIGTLLYAASKGDGTLLMKIVGQGMVSINDGDYDKRTALHIASAEGHFELVKTLVEAGADINSMDRWGGTPLDDAIRHGFERVASYLKKTGAKHGRTNFGQDLLNAASSGDLATIKTLVESGISVDSVDYDKRTPLHVAVAARDVPIVEYLLSKGANVNAVDRFGGTPITEANRVGVRIGEDDIKRMLNVQSGEHNMPWYHRFLHPFVLVVGGFEILFIILFAIFSEYGEGARGNIDPILGQEEVTRYYPFYMDVHVMIFIGFGFLMTFLKKYGYMAVGLNFLLGTMCIQWYLLVGAFFEYAIFEGEFHPVEITIPRLIKADFSAGAVLITFGALLGKTSPVQMCLLAMIELIPYSINESIGLRLGIADIGGSYVIHMFGAYFGLAASIVLTPRGARGNKDNGAVYRSDLFSMIGTIFLWMFWPSFNAALGLGNTQHRAIINTLLSISASCTVAFVFSFIVRGERKFNMVDIQNATISGGVAMGAAADMILHPAVAIGIGSLAGMVSVFGFAKLQPKIEEKFGIHDTCGVHNLHGMPSIIGAIAAISAAAWAPYSYYGPQLFVTFPRREGPDGYSASHQALLQFAYLGITLGIAIFSGIITGIIVKYVAPARRYFLDDEFWEVPELEEPYYFDKRGEIIRIDEAITERVGNDSVDQRRVDKDLESRLIEMETKINNMKNGIRQPASQVPSTGTVAMDLQAQTLLIQSLTQAVNLLAAQNDKKVQ